AGGPVDHPGGCSGHLAPTLDTAPAGLTTATPEAPSSTLAGAPGTLAPTLDTAPAGLTTATSDPVVPASSVSQTSTTPATGTTQTDALAASTATHDGSSQPITPTASSDLGVSDTPVSPLDTQHDVSFMVSAGT